MIDAVRCADRLIAEFIEEVGDAHPDLVVALLTDHLIGGGADEEVLGLLVPHPEERRLRFVVWAPDVAPGVIGHPGTHFDVMPTLMDVLGFGDWTEHYLGASLLRFESPWFSHDRPLSLRVVHELPSIQLQAGDEVRFEADGPIVDVDGRRLLATRKGLNLRDAVFAVRLDDADTGIDFRTFDDSSGESVVHEVERWADGDAIVGVLHQSDVQRLPPWRIGDRTLVGRHCRHGVLRRHLRCRDLRGRPSGHTQGHSVSIRPARRRQKVSDMRKFALALPYVLHLLPPAAAWVGGSRHVLWFASSVLVATALVGLWRTGGVATRIVVSVLNSIIALANVLLAVSFLVQGVGFNLAFFAHADWETLALASVTLRPVLIGVLAYLVVTLACPMLLGRGAYSRRGELGVVAAGLVGIGLNTPAWSFALHIGGVVADVQSALWVPKPVVELPVLALKPDARSLVLIFAESLEATYSRADLFGQDLTPRLTALAASAKQFADMRQVPLAAWSTGAFVAAQCARPVSANAWWRQAVQGGAARVDGATCLGDVLAALGYRTVFMTGVDIHFGGVETFHAAHGFVERLGFEALSPLAGTDADFGQSRHWLIEDETLFTLARTKVDELAARAEPFALVVKTADTHGPGFPSASCESTEGMLAAVRCSDRLIAEFVGGRSRCPPERGGSAVDRPSGRNVFRR